MDRERVARFADLDATAVLQFQRTVASRPGVAGATLSATTVQKYPLPADLPLPVPRRPRRRAAGRSISRAESRRRGQGPRRRHPSIALHARAWPCRLIQGAIEVVGPRVAGAAHQRRLRRRHRPSPTTRPEPVRVDEAATRALQEWQRSQPARGHAAIATPSELMQRSTCSTPPALSSSRTSSDRG